MNIQKRYLKINEIPHPRRYVIIHLKSSLVSPDSTYRGHHNVPRMFVSYPVTLYTEAIVGTKGYKLGAPFHLSYANPSNKLIVYPKK